MNAPTCQTCETRHWSKEPCPADAAPEPANAPANRVEPANSGKQAAIPRYMAGQYKDADKRREYQRDLMRQKRAEARAAKGAAR